MGCLRILYSAEESPLRVSRDEENVAIEWQVWVNETPAKKVKEVIDQQSGGDYNFNVMYHVDRFGLGSAKGSDFYLQMNYTGNEKFVGFNVVQTVKTNKPLDGKKSHDIDGKSPPLYFDKYDVKAFSNVGGYDLNFNDRPVRASNQGLVLWQAETSFVGIRQDGSVHRIFTGTWGFTIYKGKVTQHKFQVENNPSSFHLNQFK